MIRFSTALRDAIASNYGLGMVMNKGVIRIYGDPMPASPDDAPTGLLLAEITNEGRTYFPGINKDSAGLVVRLELAGQLRNYGNWRMIGKNTGVAKWFRWYSSQVDNYGTNTDFLRIDGSTDSELFLSNENITPLTNVGISTFSMQLQMSN